MAFVQKNVASALVADPDTLQFKIIKESRLLSVLQLPGLKPSFILHRQTESELRLVPATLAVCSLSN